MRSGRRVSRSRRDWAVDIGLFLFAACFGMVTSEQIAGLEELSPAWRAVDQVVGGLACAAVFLRRRWPVALAVVLLTAGVWAHFVTGPLLVALFTVAAYRPWRTTAWVAALAFAPLPWFLGELPGMEEQRAGSGVTYFALIAGSIGWGLFRHAQRELIASLRDRAERAEAEAALRAERAQRMVREDIAREMHDVLAHRLSLLSVHAGALEFHPSAPAEEVRRAAGVIREASHAALQDLREVIGVLRATTSAGESGEGRPQPTLGDVERLVEEARGAGTDVVYEPLDSAAEFSGTVGRTVYRIVQEGLTNARKHAPGAPVRVRVSGRAGDELRVEVRNTVPGPAVSGPGTRIPGAGQGLAGLAERARLAGGRLEYGRFGADFRIKAWLPWPARPS
ncbi:sensor histidine kinase [Streptomyces gamaensis]|uniref:histidine kinase n=1 Tax=Streptomyces gamaensis TaxID=1763542 RepID=A0ABW0Z3Y9_9ACTN